jgi:hypothetical protein
MHAIVVQKACYSRQLMQYLQQAIHGKQFFIRLYTLNRKLIAVASVASGGMGKKLLIFHKSSLIMSPSRNDHG